MVETEHNTVTFGGDKTYSLDSYGFLDPPQQWDEGFAAGMAEMQDIYGGLTERHWDVIRYLRKRFIEDETVPVVIIACADNNLRLDDLRFLFPTGYHRGACRIAGINYDFIYNCNYWITYETTVIPRTEHMVTPQGFLKEFDQWNERFAQTVIREWKLSCGLTDRHREIIEYMRDYYSKTKNIPTVYEACNANDLSLAELIEMFPGGYHRGLCRIAGLPSSM